MRSSVLDKRNIFSNIVISTNSIRDFKKRCNDLLKLVIISQINKIIIIYSWNQPSALISIFKFVFTFALSVLEKGLGIIGEFMIYII